MTTLRAPIEAARIELYAPVASFRDPMFPGVSRCLPVPPLSTVRGMLAAATGNASESVPVGMCAHAEGQGTDAETYHPIAADGSNPAVAGQVSEGKGGRTVRDRPFLCGVHVTLWVPSPDAERITAALRCPVWGLRLGRSQDLVHVRSITSVRLSPTSDAVVGHGLAPVGSHTASQATTLRLADTVSSDRLQTSFSSYLWCPEPAGNHQVLGAYRDPTDDQAVWLHGTDEPPPEDPELANVLAKSAQHSPSGQPETLTEHSRTVHEAAHTVAERISSPGVLSEQSAFWNWVETAALLHDAGKVAEGFQRQLRPDGPPWGERHEVLSLAYVDLLTRGLFERDQKMVAAGVAFHHLSLDSSGQGLEELYPAVADWEKKFGRDPDPEPGRPRVQVPRNRHRALLAWLSTRLGTTAPEGEGRKLWERARDTFARARSDWSSPVSAEEGLVAVLLQGAVTLADHSGSAHVPLQTHMPLPSQFLDTLAAPYPHQHAAAETQGHLVLRAPTGSGKTEATLAWASHQLDDMDGHPRLVWVLPYRASIDAAWKRFRNALVAEPGEDEPDIAVLHATTAHTLLTHAAAGDTTTGDSGTPDRVRAQQARDRAHAMRTLFAQRVRVSTPHQLLRAAIAGPRYSSFLLEQANALLVLDELHAYDPTTFGRICAAMSLWEQLGSRIAIASATLAPPMLELIHDTLTHEVTVHTASPEAAPDRHRLALDEEPITHPDSVKRIRAWLQEGHSVLVVANTVATAQSLYAELAPDARTAHPDDPEAAILLHSRFRGCDRDDIEERITTRYPERGSDESPRRGGLVVSTQALEVSLCLDLDRGVSELAPVEALAQRAGRVNRRGRHPDGPVEFRVHRTEDSRPYDPKATAAAWQALTQAPGPVISEQTIGEWLRLAYATDWGRSWTEEARNARDEFAASFLTFTDPFHDRSDYAQGLDESFDTVEILHHDDVADYVEKAAEHPLLAAGLLIPIRFGQFMKLRSSGRAALNDRLRVWSTDIPYDPETGLQLPAPHDYVAQPETIL